jgi:hypothetical protein
LAERLRSDEGRGKLLSFEAREIVGRNIADRTEQTDYSTKMLIEEFITSIDVEYKCNTPYATFLLNLKDQLCFFCQKKKLDTYFRDNFHCPKDPVMPVIRH